MFKKVFFFSSLIISILFILFLTSSKSNILEERVKESISFEPEEGYYGSIITIKLNDAVK